MSLARLANSIGTISNCQFKQKLLPSLIYINIIKVAGMVRRHSGGVIGGVVDFGGGNVWEVGGGKDLELSLQLPCIV
jgi:hypothetical protein